MVPHPNPTWYSSIGAHLGSLPFRHAHWLRLHILFLRNLGLGASLFIGEAADTADVGAGTGRPER